MTNNFEKDTYNVSENKVLLESKSGIIEQIGEVNDDIIKILCDIQQDTWSSNFLKEFVECEDCGKILGKEDIFGVKDNNYSKKTVQELMGEYSGKDIECPDCSGKTNFLRGYGINQDIEKHFKESIDSFVVALRNKVGEIIGFSYCYIDYLEQIYNNEFYATFKPGLLNHFPDNKEVMLSIPCTAMFEKDINIYDVFTLLKGLSMAVNRDKYGETRGIFESIIGSLTFKLFEAMGGEALNFDKKNPELYNYGDISKKDSEVSDIIIHPNIANSYYEQLKGKTFNDFKAKLKS